MNSASKILTSLEWLCKLRTLVLILGKIILISKYQVVALAFLTGAPSSGVLLLGHGVKGMVA